MGILVIFSYYGHFYRLMFLSIVEFILSFISRRILCSFFCSRMFFRFLFILLIIRSLGISYLLLIFFVNDTFFLFISTKLIPLRINIASYIRRWTFDSLTSAFGEVFTIFLVTFLESYLAEVGFLARIPMEYFVIYFISIINSNILVGCLEWAIRLLLWNILSKTQTYTFILIFIIKSWYWVDLNKLDKHL